MGISLLMEVYKIYSKIITQCVNKIAKVIFLEEQAGFIKGR
jgi:hypothetical protein